MRLASIIILFLAAMAPAPATAQAQPGQTLREACASLAMADGCALIAEAARMLEPSYAGNKAVGGVAAFRALGYDATYFPARSHFLGSTTDIFLVSRRQSNRLFVVITGTESSRDWYENAKFGRHDPDYRNGEFYIPPGHAGFRRGMRNVVDHGVLAMNEFDERPLDCASLRPAASGLARHLCQHGVRNGPDLVDTVIVGHSRGAGIGILLATAFAGLEIQRPNPNGPARVARQTHWPLRLHAVIGFAPPYAVYSATDAQAPAGLADHWSILREHGIPERTIWFLNDRDIVPNLSFGQGRHFGHRFRIRGNRQVSYDGMDWGEDVSFSAAHSSLGYCADTLAALEQEGRCRRKPQGR